jgi:hypothetical protein
LLLNADNPGNRIGLRNTEAATTTFPIKLVPAEVRLAAEIGTAFQDLSGEHTEAAIVFQDALFNDERELIR